MDDGASPMVQWVKNPSAMQQTPEIGVLPLGQGDPPGEGTGNPLQYSCLENSMARGAWRATVHEIINSQSDITKHTHLNDAGKSTEAKTGSRAGLEVQWQGFLIASAGDLMVR